MDWSNTENARVRKVRVTNNGLEPAFSDRWDGVPVTIPNGKTEDIPLDMAAHFFGPSFDHSAMLRHVSRRQGWNTPEHVKVNPETGKTLAQSNFDKLKIEPVMFKLVEETAQDPKAPVPAEQDIAEAPRAKRTNKLMSESYS